MSGKLLLRHASEMAKYSAHRTLLWGLIATRITYMNSSENGVSETTAIAPSSMLDRAFVSEKHWSSVLEVSFR